MLKELLTDAQLVCLLNAQEIRCENIVIPPVSLREILDPQTIGYDRYLTMFSILNIDRLTLLERYKNDFSGFSLLQIHMGIEAIASTLLDLIQTMLRPKCIDWLAEDAQIHIHNQDGSIGVLNAENYRRFCRILAKVYDVYLYDIEEDLNFFNETVRDHWRLYEYRRRKGLQNETSTSNFAAVMSGVINKGKVYNYSTIAELTMYQLYDSFYRLNLIDSTDDIRRIRYSGNVDTTKIKLPDSHWADIINLDKKNTLEIN